MIILISINTSATADGNIRIYNTKVFAGHRVIDDINSDIAIQCFGSTFRSTGETFVFTGAGATGGTVTIGNMVFDTTPAGGGGALIAVNAGAATGCTILSNIDTTAAPPQIVDSTSLGGVGTGAKIDTTGGGGGGITVTALNRIEYF